MSKSKNNITGDSLRSKELSQQGKDNWDKIFGKKLLCNDCKLPLDLVGVCTSCEYLTDGECPDITSNQVDNILKICI